MTHAPYMKNIDGLSGANTLDQVYGMILWFQQLNVHKHSDINKCSWCGNGSIFLCFESEDTVCE